MAEAVALIVIGTLASLTVVIFIAAIVATILVAGSVRAEERRRRLAFRAGSRMIRLARWLSFVSDLRPVIVTDEDPEEETPWYERSEDPSWL